MDKLEEIVHFLLIQNSQIRFLFFFLSSFLENLFPPWPGDAITVFGGFLAYKGENLFLLTTATFFGNLAGGIFMYKMGNKFLLFLEKRKLYAKKTLKQVFIWFETYSYILVAASRFMAGCKFLICPICGILKMNFLLFLFYFSISVILWNTILIYGGYFLAENWSFFLKILKTYTFSIVFILIFFVIFFILVKCKKNCTIKEVKNETL